MKHLTRTKVTVLASVVVGLALAGCGSSGSAASTASTLSGVAAAEAPLGGARLTVKDSSTAPQQKTAATSGDGTFSLDVTGLQPPFMLQADWTDDTGSHTLHGVADKPGKTRVDPLTEIAYEAAVTSGDGGSGEADDREGHEHTAASVSAFLQQLRTALAPLFDLYGVGSDLENVDPTAMKTLLQAVQFSVEDGTLAVTNRATGAVIFTGPLANLASGTFHQENLPAGPGTTPPPAACTYTYGAWGSCQADGTQTRTVASSSPSGCTGSPVLSQACTYTPPTSTCTSFTYSAWGACSASGMQTRIVASSAPAGCTGGSPVLSQSCTPPVTNPVTTADIVASCTGCHGLTSNTTVYKSGGYTVSGRSSAQWLTTVDNMIGQGAALAAGTTAQNYADALANAP